MNRYLYGILFLFILYCTCILPVDEETSPPDEWPVTVYFTSGEDSLSSRCENKTRVDLEISSDGMSPYFLSDSTGTHFITISMLPGPERTFRATWFNNRDGYLWQMSDTGSLTIDIKKEFNFVTINLTPIAPPVIVSAPENCSIMYSGIAHFKVIAQGLDLKYTWEKDGRPIDPIHIYGPMSPYSFTSSSKSLYVTGRDSGSVITCTVCNASGCVESAPANISVVCDTIPPKLFMLDSVVEIYLHSIYKDDVVFAYDSIDRNLTNQIVRTGDINTSIAGQYDLHYSVSDGCGNTATATRTVIIRPYTDEEKMRPVIKISGLDTVFINNGYGIEYYFDQYSDSAFQAFDRDSQDITADVVVTKGRELSLFGINYLEFNVRDKYGVSAYTRRRFFCYWRTINKLDVF